MAAATFATLLLGLVVACTTDDGQACYEGDWLACACADGGQTGYQQCTAHATYGACDCSGDYPFLADSGMVDSGEAASTVDAADAPALHTITQPCMTDMDCAAGLECYHFNARGPECTHACTMSSQCEAPSPGCSNMQVCKSL